MDVLEQTRFRATQPARQPLRRGYGVDPKMDSYMAPWPGLLSKAQLAKIASLAGLVLSPGRPRAGKLPAGRRRIADRARSTHAEAGSLM